MINDDVVQSSFAAYSVLQLELSASERIVLTFLQIAVQVF